MEPVGELDQDDADVADHGEQHLAQVLGLLVLVGADRQLRDLGLALDDATHDGAEALLDLLEGDGRVLDRVVEQPGDHGVAVEVHLGQQRRDRHRVGDVRLARAALDAAMRLLGDVERLGDPGARAVGQVRDGVEKAGLEPLHLSRRGYHGVRCRSDRGATRFERHRRARAASSTTPSAPSTRFAAHGPAHGTRTPEIESSCPKV